MKEINDMQDNKTMYRIRVKGHLNSQWATWFDDMSLTYESGETTISGPVADQAALHGLLARIRDLGLALIDVSREDADHNNTDSTQ